MPSVSRLDRRSKVKSEKVKKNNVKRIMLMETRRYEMLKKVWLLLPFCLFAFLHTHAQNFTQRIQQPMAGKGSVVIHQSDSIDQLVNTAVLSNRAVKHTATTPPASTETPSSAATASTTKPDTSATTQQGEQTTTEEEGTRVIHGSYTVMGYRVQAFAGGNSRADRQRAEATRSSIKAIYPNVPVYVHFFSPRWICRVGNYRTYEEAHQMQTNLKNMGFNQCTIVKGKISVAY